MPGLDASKIFNRLINFLRLRGFPGNAELMPTVQPIVDITEWGGFSESAAPTTDISAGAVTAIHTVPAGERWRIQALRKSATVGTVGITVTHARGGATVGLTAPATAETVLQPPLLWLDAGDTMGMTAGNVADTAVALAISFLRYSA